MKTVRHLKQRRKERKKEESRKKKEALQQQRELLQRDKDHEISVEDYLRLINGENGSSSYKDPKEIIIMMMRLTTILLSIMV